MKVNENEETVIVRLASIYVDNNCAEKLKTIGNKEKRTMARQAAYILEKWALEQK